MKKFLLIVMAVAMTGSFTSCVENEVPAEIEAIYNNQADLLAAQSALLEAQAAVEAANAAYVQAQAQYEAARASLLAAQAAAQEIANQFASAANAIELEELQAQLEAQQAAYAAQIAAAQLQAEQNRIALERAQAQWAAEMEAMAAAVVAAQEAALEAAFLKYTTEKQALDNMMLAELTAQQDIYNQMTAASNAARNREMAMATIQDNIANFTEEIANWEAQIADAQALLEPGTTNGDYLTLQAEYQAAVEALDAEVFALELDIKIAEEAFNVADAELTNSGYFNISAEYAALQAAHQQALNDANAARQAIAGLEAQIETNDDNIVLWTAAVADYDATTTALQAAVASAEAAEDAAAAAYAAAQAATAAANVALNGNGLAPGAAGYVEGAAPAAARVLNEWNTAQADLNQAATDYADAVQNAIDPQILQDAVDAAQDALDDANDEYAAAVAAFEADPAGARVTDPGIDGVAGGIEALGFNNFAPVTNWVLVTGFNAGEPVFNLANRFESMQDAIDWMEDQGANGVTLQDGNNAFAFFPNNPFDLWNPADVTTTNANNEGDYYFFNVTADDGLIQSNVDRLNAAAGAIDPAEAALEAAQLAQTQAQQGLATALAAYEAAEAFFAAKDAELAAANAAATAAAADLTAAQTAEAAANVALNGNGLPANNANFVNGAVNDTLDAVAALNGHLATTQQQYQDWLDQATVDAVYLADDLAAAQADLAEAEADAEAIREAVEAGPTLNARQAAAVAAWVEAANARGALYAQRGAIFTEIGQLNQMIAFIDQVVIANDPANVRPALEGAIVNFTTNLEIAQANLAAEEEALFQAMNNDANLATLDQFTMDRLEMILAEIQAEIEIQQAKVDVAKANLDALL